MVRESLLVVPIIPIFMIDLDQKQPLKKIELIEKSAKKDRFTHWSMIDLLFTIDNEKRWISLWLIRYSQAKKEAEIKMSSFVSIIHYD